MGLKARLEALNPDARVLKFLDHISKTCRIPPNPRIQAMPMPKLLATAVAMGILMMAGLMATAPPPLAVPLGGVIDEDFILPNRNPPSWPPHPSGGPPGGGFWMVGHETLVIRDCTMYTTGSAVCCDDGTLKPPGGLEVPYGGYAIGITLEDFANLTMINVRVYPAIDISVMGNAYLKMVNVTNYHPGWTSHYHMGQPGVVSMTSSSGVIGVRDNARAWVENSKVAAVGAGATVTNSWLASSMGYTAVKVKGTMEKTEFEWGEPISMTLSLENVGETALNFTGDKDYFKIIAYEYAEGEKYTVYRYRSVQPEFLFPSRLGPGEAIVQAFTLRGDGSTPFEIVIQDGARRIVTGQWWNSSLDPGRYTVEGVIVSESLDLALSCGGYVVTITEERWQGYER